MHIAADASNDYAHAFGIDDHPGMLDAGAAIEAEATFLPKKPSNAGARDAVVLATAAEGVAKEARDKALAINEGSQTTTATYHQREGALRKSFLAARADVAPLTRILA